MSCLSFEYEALQRLMAGSLALPTLPDLALRINEMAQSERIGIRDVVDVIAADPAIAARLVQSANSAASASRIKVNSLQMAVTRLGLQYTRALVNRLALEQMFFAREPVLNALMRTTWTCSVEVAAFSEALARHRTPLRPEIAMLAGLVHRVGLLPLIRLADEEGGRFDLSAGDLEVTLRRLQGRVGHMLLRRWGFSQQLQEVPLASEACGRDMRGAADYTDLVIVSRWQLGDYPVPAGHGLRPSAVPALDKLGLKPEVDLLKLPPVYDSYARALTRLAA